MLAVEKRTQSLLLDSDSIEKIMEIDNHIGCAMSGLTADARTMVEHARVTAQVRAGWLAPGARPQNLSLTKPCWRRSTRTTTLHTTSPSRWNL